jgi:hypothetical protein
VSEPAIGALVANVAAPLVFALAFFGGFSGRVPAYPAAAVLVACAVPGFLVPGLAWSLIDAALIAGCIYGVLDAHWNTSSYAGWSALVFVPLAGVTTLALGVRAGWIVLSG